MDDEISTREYLEKRFQDHNEAHRREHTMLEEALREARTVVDSRLKEMNHLRDQITSERGQFLTVSTYDAKHEVLTTRITNLEKQQANFQGRLVIISLISTIVGAVFIFIIERVLIK